MTSRNASRRPVYEHFEGLRARYAFARELECLETLHPYLDALGKDPPPPDGSALLEALGKYRDYRALYQDLEAKFLAYCERDRQDTLAAIRRHADAGELASAVLVAVLGRHEFQGRASREAFEAELAGFADAVAAGDIPEGLERITICEMSPRRAQQLHIVLSRLLPDGFIPIPGQDA